MSANDETSPVTRPLGISPAAERPKSGPPPLPVKSKSVPAAPKVEEHKIPAPLHSEGEGHQPPLEAFSPVVGWLVILEGPGRGASLTLGFGMNHMGRSASNRIILDFGDEKISPKTHTTLTYDPRGKKFYVQPGLDTMDLTYLGEEPLLKPVLMPTEIFGGESITLGRTKLKFVAFCGPQFSWD